MRFKPAGVPLTCEELEAWTNHETQQRILKLFGVHPPPEEPGFHY